MGDLQDNCPHTVLERDDNFVWCARCGKTKQHWEVEGVNYDD